MTALPQSISTDPKFDFHTTSMGRVVVSNLLGKHKQDIDKFLGSRKQPSPSELADFLIGILSITGAGIPLTSQQIALLTEAEKEDFAEQLVDAESYLYRKKVQNRQKDESGKTVVSYSDGDIIFPRNHDETARDYFFRAFINYRNNTLHTLD